MAALPTQPLVGSPSIPLYIAELPISLQPSFFIVLSLSLSLSLSHTPMSTSSSSSLSLAFLNPLYLLEFYPLDDEERPVAKKQAPLPPFRSKKRRQDVAQLDDVPAPRHVRPVETAAETEERLIDELVDSIILASGNIVA